jgi:hypothetical protein
VVDLLEMEMEMDGQLNSIKGKATSQKLSAGKKPRFEIPGQGWIKSDSTTAVRKECSDKQGRGNGL